MSELLFFLALSLIYGRGAWMATRGRIVGGVVSMIGATIYFLCLWVPAHLQANGTIVSKLVRAQLIRLPDTNEIASLSLYWTLELLVILAAEMIGVALLAKRLRIAVATTRRVDRASRWIVTTLLLLGVMALVLFPSGSIQDRAEGGQGLGVVLRSFFVVGLAALAYNNFFKNLLGWIAGLSGVAILIAASIRSPLLVVAFGYIAGLISRQDLRLGRAGLFAILGVVLALAAGVMSSVRADIIRGGRVEASAIISDILARPASVYEAGIDTLDGYRLSAAIAPREPADPANLLTIVTNFIPRALWPDKPDDLSVRMSAKYLGYGQGGQFLSPIGYLTIALGSYLAALAGLAFIVLALSMLAIVLKNSFLLTLVLVVTFRFMIGGAPFDIYYGLTLTIPYGIASAVVGSIMALSKPPQRLRVK